MADALAVGHGETIAAISTPAGEGAIALVRISGPEAITIADEIFRGRAKPSEFESHVQHLGEIVEDGQMIDQVRRLRASHAAQLHRRGFGRDQLSRRRARHRARVGGLSASWRPRGRAGEFTERAFLNGKMDLTQAEAVIDMIRATTDLAPAFRDRAIGRPPRRRDQNHSR